ncbi:MAG: four helix bundle protein [Bacteroidetes bacterium]|nr:four helix bundle protein [Bacteroidota bacterium]
MFLQLNHKKLDVYISSKELVVEIYKLSTFFPVEEKFGLISQIRRAAVSVTLNISEGASRKSIADRKRFYEIARGSLIEVDAGLEIANELGFLKTYDTNLIKQTIIKTFKLLSGMINAV